MSSGNPVEGKEEIEAIAAAKGLVCIFPAANELALDLDEVNCANSAVVRVLNDNGILHVADTLMTSSAGGNLHLYIRFYRTFTITERALFQAVLGSDPIREILSYLRFENGKRDQELFCHV